jgi:hypothetical protein
MMARASLFIIFLDILKTTAFLLQQQPQIASWLWLKIQADAKKQKRLLNKLQTESQYLTIL